MSESFQQIDFLKEALDRTQKERDELKTECSYLNAQVELLKDAQFKDCEDPPPDPRAANRAKYQAVFDHLHSLLLTQQCIGVSGLPELVGEFDRMLTRIEGWGT